MRRNEYKQKTKILQIPVVGPKDGIWPDVEMRKWTIVENLLLAARKGIQNCLFQEGAYALKDNVVTLQATGQAPSAEGVSGGVYFNAPPRLQWELPEGENSCYLYLTSSSKTLFDHSSVRTVASVNRSHGKHVLCAWVDIKNRAIEKMPLGKMFAANIEQHVSVWENPHGKTLIQDEIQVKQLMVAGKEVRGSGVVDFETGGMDGVVVTAESPVSFVQVSRTGEDVSGSLGEVSVGYFGSDEKSVNPEDFVVYNEGDSGLNVRALFS